jgi:hypothetical protein
MNIEDEKKEAKNKYLERPWLQSYPEGLPSDLL